MSFRVSPAVAGVSSHHHANGEPEINFNQGFTYLVQFDLSALFSAFSLFPLQPASLNSR
jgi:hypothetical protein